MKRVMTRSTWIVVLLILLTLSGIHAQETLKVDVRMVEVYAFVFDGKGNRVQNLSRDNFEVFEDGVRQSIDVFEPETAGVNVALLIDTTGSMVRQLPRVKNAIADLLTTLGPDDSVGLFSFSNRLNQLQGFTKDRNAVLTSLLSSRASGQTALYDSLAQLARSLSKDGGKKAILLFTDGLDNASVLTLDSAVINIRRIGVPIYTVVQGEVLQRVDLTKPLKEISESTNGISFEARKPEDLRDIFTKVGGDLQHLYLLGYYPSNSATNADWHKIAVRLPKHPELKLRTKEGYWK